MTAKTCRWHKSFGITVLALATLRLLWRLATKRLAALEAHKKWERVLAKLIHTLLYICLFAMPLSGWVMSSAKGITISVFELFDLPNLVQPNKELGHLMVETHEVIAKVLIAAIALHFAGALKHHFIDKDSTLRRMLPFAKASIMLVASVLLLSSGKSYAADAIDSWVIDHEQSSLTFEGTQARAPFTGEFKKFDGEILFDPEHLDASKVSIKIAMDSFDTKSPDRDANLVTSPWFFVESFPESKFEASKFDKVEENQYVAHANLTIRDVTLPIDFPFSLEITPDGSGNKIAKMQGEISLNRLDFGIGQGEWKDTATVGNPVKVRVSLLARTQKPASK